MINQQDILKYGDISKVIYYFQEIDKIPRKSGNEIGMVDFLKDFCKQHNLLSFYSDKYNNVIIRKKSTNGQDNYIAFQSHLDMICEKIDGSNHDFSKDPINLTINGDYIESKETSIGADNGIGVAYMLALLASHNLSHPNLEMIFTAEEETSMNGAKNIDLSLIKSNRIISLDAFSDDTINCGCASNYSRYFKLQHSQIFGKHPQLNHSYKIELKGFLGGHSGKDISQNRGNAIVSLGKILNSIKEGTPIVINKLDAGTWVTSIPVSAELIFSSSNINLDKFIAELAQQEKELQHTYNNPDISISIQPVKQQDNYFDIDDTNKIIDFISHFPSGSIYEDKKTGNTLLSANLGTIWIDDIGSLFLETSIRSNLKDNYTKFFIEKMKKFEDKLGLDTLETYDFPGYVQNKDSEFINFLSRKYTEVYGKEPIKKEEHFLLECAWFASKKPDLEYVSISPNIENPHSTSEKVSISSMQKMWEFIKRISRDLDRDKNNPIRENDGIDR